MPARSRSEAIPVLRELVMPATLAAIGAAALAAKGLLIPVNMYDAGISASAGTFLLHGLVPYRDFWMLYGPLGGLFAAVVGLISPPSVTAVQLVGLMLVAAQSAAGYVLLRRLRLAPIAALMVAIVAASAPSALTGLEISAWQCAVIAALVALSLASVADGRRARLLAGAIVGLSLLFRQDVGAYAVLAVVVACRNAWPVIGLSIVVGPAALVLLANVPLGALYEQLVWYPIVGQSLYRGVPDPLSLVSGPMAVSLMVVFVWGARASIVIAAVRASAAREAAVSGLLVFAMLCQLQTLVRGDFYHFAQAAGPAFLCLGTMLTPRDVARRWEAGALGSVVAVLAVVAATASPISIADAPAYQASVEQAVAYIRQNTPPTEPIFVGLTSNRYTFANPLMVYYLADRPPGARDTMYNPGLTNRDATQRQMIGDLERSGTRYLVLDRPSAMTCEPFSASCQPGSARLDEYIGTHFQIAADFKDIVVMVRR